MKYLIGFIAGVGAAWAALAIWQRLPEFPDVDEPVADITSALETEEGFFIKGTMLSDTFPSYPSLIRGFYPPYQP